jgi:hypothetical protein
LHQQATEMGFKCRRACTYEDHYLAVLQKPWCVSFSLRA